MVQVVAWYMGQCCFAPFSVIKPQNVNREVYLSLKHAVVITRSSFDGDFTTVLSLYLYIAIDPIRIYAQDDFPSNTISP